VHPGSQAPSGTARRQVWVWFLEVVAVVVEVEVVVGAFLQRQQLALPSLQCVPVICTSILANCPTAQLKARASHLGTSWHRTHEPTPDVSQAVLGTKSQRKVRYYRHLRILPWRHTSHNCGPLDNLCNRFSLGTECWSSS
jgi:hypothetical protein